MKPVLSLILFLLCSWNLYSQSSGKAALIVSLSNYAPGSNWPATSAFNDVSLVKDALIHQGFKNADIQVLQDDEATKSGIEQAIQTELLAKATEGGTVVLHFSGHGQKVQDDNGDEPNGLDAAFVPYDSPKYFKPGQYQGQNLLRDERISQLLEPVRQKLGPKGSLLLVLDASYNGADSRGEITGRGTEVVMANPEFIAQMKAKGQNAKPEGLNFLGAETSPKLAPAIVILAATEGAAGETINEDGKTVGALTYAFAKSLWETDPGSTYNSLMNDIRRVMSVHAPAQSPGLEGEGSQPILGKTASSSAHFAVANVDNKQKQLSLQAGLFQGVVVGSELAFFPAGLRDTAGVQPLATGIVTSSNLKTAEVSWKGNVSKEKLGKSQAWFRLKRFGGLTVDLSLNLPDDGVHQRIRKQCQELPFVHIVDKNADVQVFVPDSGWVELQNRAGISLYHDLASTAMYGALAEHIRQHAQAQYFRNLTLNEAALQVSMELIPVSVMKQKGKTVEQTRYSIAERTDPLGNIRFKKGDYFKISATNKGTRPAYLTALYIQPDDNVAVLIPQQAQTAQWLVPAGEKAENQAIFRITPPDGNCVLKLIASETPLDLSEVLANKGKMMRSETGAKRSSVEYFFAETFQDGTVLPPIAPGSANINTLIFRIGNE